MEQTPNTNTSSEVPQAQIQPVKQPAKTSSNPWPWIVGGCLTIVVIIVGAIVLLGWWGIRAADKQMDKLDPALKDVGGTIERMNQESAQWEKKSQELRENIPSTGDIQGQLEN